MAFGRKRTKEGFTLIELSLAIAFISVLLITVTVITSEIIQIYRKGYTINAVNRSGRDIIDEFQSSIIQSPPPSIASFCEEQYSGKDDMKNICKSVNRGFYSIYQQFYTGVKVTTVSDDENFKQVPTGGIFCSGKYTYIWNTGYLYNKNNDYEFQGNGKQEDLRNAHKLVVKYYLQGSSNQKTAQPEDFRLLKIEDPSGAICTSTLEDHYPSTSVLSGPGGTTNYTIEVPFTLLEDPVELLYENDSDLALYDLVVFEPARVAAAERVLFSGSFILGTANSGVDIMSTNEFCKTPDYFSSDFSYCAINKFNFTVQTSGK